MMKTIVIIMAIAIAILFLIIIYLIYKIFIAYNLLNVIFFAGNFNYNRMEFPDEYSRQNFMKWIKFIRKVTFKKETLQYLPNTKI